jgi:hypothetical protein
LCVDDERSGRKGIEERGREGRRGKLTGEPPRNGRSLTIVVNYLFDIKQGERSSSRKWEKGPHHGRESYSEPSIAGIVDRMVG